MKFLFIKLLIRLGFTVELRTKDQAKSGAILVPTTAVVLMAKTKFPSCSFYLTSNGSTKVARHSLDESYKLISNYKLYFYRIDKYTNNKFLHKGLKLLNSALIWRLNGKQ
jgi:hypothetical protein